MMSILNVRKSSSCNRFFQFNILRSYADEKEEWYRESKREGSVAPPCVRINLWSFSSSFKSLRAVIGTMSNISQIQKLKSVQNEINNLIFFVDVYLFSTK